MLEHSKIESAVRCLGIEVEDAIEIAQKTSIGSLTDYLRFRTWQVAPSASPMV